MQIININSEIKITPSQKSFIEEILFCGNDLRMIEEDSFYWLSKNIPIFLINEDSMKKNEKNSEYRYEKNSDFKPHTEWLGFYVRDSSGLFEHTPRIAICPERIASCVNNDEEFTFLLAKVIVHEFAHAKMDFYDQNVKYRKKDTFWHWMEESSANRYTLEVFYNFTKRCRYHRNNNKSSFGNKTWEKTLFDFVVDFVKKQPPEYALGYELFEKGPVFDWEWKIKKEDLGGQKRANEKSDWLKYMKKNYKGINTKQASICFIAVLGIGKGVHNFDSSLIYYTLENVSKADGSMNNSAAYDNEIYFEFKSFESAYNIAKQIYAEIGKSTLRCDVSARNLYKDSLYFKTILNSKNARACVVFSFYGKLPPELIDVARTKRVNGKKMDDRREKWSKE